MGKLVEDILALKHGQLIKVVYPSLNYTKRKYMVCIVNNKTWKCKIKLNELKNGRHVSINCLAFINLAGELMVNTTFGMDADCYLEKISIDDYMEFSHLLRCYNLKYSIKNHFLSSYGKR